jgi:hypothetical protein
MHVPAVFPNCIQYSGAATVVHPYAVHEVRVRTLDFKIEDRRRRPVKAQVDNLDWLAVGRTGVKGVASEHAERTRHGLSEAYSTNGVLVKSFFVSGSTRGP